jgi:ATP-dependent DNA helicase MPH1
MDEDDYDDISDEDLMLAFDQTQDPSLPLTTNSDPSSGPSFVSLGVIYSTCNALTLL